MTGNGRTAEVAAHGNVVSEFLKDDGLMSLNAEMTVAEDSTSRAFLVGTGVPAFALQPAYPLTWSQTASTPRRPIQGTISFTATTGTYLANVTAETLQSEVGVPKESVPLAGIPNLPVAMNAQPVIGITYGKATAGIGIQTEQDIYAGIVRTSDMVAIAQDCALSQDDCDTLAAGIDDALADEVTVDVDWLTIVSALGVAYDDNFDPVFQPME